MSIRVEQLPAGMWECQSCLSYNHSSLSSCRCCGHSKGDPTIHSSTACDEESELHEDIEKFLSGQGWPFFHQRMDKPHTDKLGTPDFIIAMPKGRVLFVECKSKTGKVSIEQAAMAAALKKHGHWCYIVRSFDEFKSAMKGAL